MEGYHNRETNTRHLVTIGKKTDIKKLQRVSRHGIKEALKKST